MSEEVDIPQETLDDDAQSEENLETSEQAQQVDANIEENDQKNEIDLEPEQNVQHEEDIAQEAGQEGENHQNNEEIEDNAQDYVEETGEPSTSAELSYNPNVIAWGTALYAYHDEESSEGLTFNEGDTIGILEHMDDGWSRGEFNGVQGVYPTSYVQEISDYENQQQTENDESNQQSQPDEASQRRKEKRMQLKGEMKDLKTELQNKVKEREQLEKEIAERTAFSQAQKKELAKRKAEMSNSLSLLPDLLRLMYAMDNYSDAAKFARKYQTILLTEEFPTILSDLQREAKTTPAFATYAQKLIGDVKETKTQADALNAANDELQKLKNDLASELDKFAQTLLQAQK